MAVSVLAIVQARMGSTRLPGKVLKKIKSKSLIEILFHRLSQSKKIDKIILATAENKENDIIIYGSAEEIKGGVKVNSNYDHRIAMSFLILGGVSQKPIEVSGCKSILTSYPNFLKQMNSIGLDIRGNEQKK